MADASAFPYGLRVLVVDDDPTWLKILEKMLRKCSYEVTTCGLARVALDILRERRNKFDIVISDVNMPDMDGFKLLEHIGLEMDLPVIMMSIDGETSRVMKGVQHGACDYLLKPVRMKELRNIWQHIYRKKMHEVKEIEDHDSCDDLQVFRYGFEGFDEKGLFMTADSDTTRKRKDVDKDHADQDSDGAAAKKARVVWSVDLHQKFVHAVNQIGFDKVGPKKILDLMNVPGLTRENVASHLQKYLLYLGRLQKQNKDSYPTTTMSDLCNLPAANVAGSEASSYVIKIDGYSKINVRVKPGDYVKSIPFSVGCHDWAVAYYPNGTTCHNENKPADSISVFLLLDSAMAKDVKAKARFSLLDKHGKSVESQSRTTMEYIFPRKGSNWGFSDFIKKADLEGSAHLIDDGFSIRCDVTVVKHIPKGKKFVVVPPSDLHQHLGGLLKSMDGADVTFNVGGESFSAHRVVVAARSSVFRAELFGDMKEKAGSPIEISDMESDVFKSLLHFIYTDSLPHGGDAQNDGVMAGHLLVAADRYNIERLKLICEEKLCDLIDSEIVATSLALAEQHGFHRIKEACFEFLTSPSNLEAMMASDGYEHLKSCCPSVLKELAASFLPAELKAVKDIIMTV